MAKRNNKHDSRKLSPLSLRGIYVKSRDRATKIETWEGEYIPLKARAVVDKTQGEGNPKKKKSR